MTDVLGLARVGVVVSGGPLALAVGGAVGPVAAARRWPDRLRPTGARRLAWALTGAAYVLLIELPHAVMECRMLLGIKTRAEAAHRGSSPRVG